MTEPVKLYIRAEPYKGEDEEGLSFDGIKIIGDVKKSFTQRKSSRTTPLSRSANSRTWSLLKSNSGLSRTPTSCLNPNTCPVDQFQHLLAGTPSSPAGAVLVYIQRSDSF